MTPGSLGRKPEPLSRDVAHDRSVLYVGVPSVDPLYNFSTPDLSLSQGVALGWTTGFWLQEGKRIMGLGAL